MSLGSVSTENNPKWCSGGYVHIRQSHARALIIYSERQRQVDVTFTINRNSTHHYCSHSFATPPRSQLALIMAVAHAARSWSSTCAPHFRTSLPFNPST
uniref:Uncharacterized protein n=1 Tax=Kalanchoe fedtschenkoi TaxID=63787 RepID=A0A7N0U853_KALFE